MLLNIWAIFLLQQMFISALSIITKKKWEGIQCLRVEGLLNKSNIHTMGYNATFTNDRKEELILSGNVLHIELSGREKELQNLILLKQKSKKA